MPTGLLSGLAGFTLIAVLAGPARAQPAEPPDSPTTPDPKDDAASGDTTGDATTPTGDPTAGEEASLTVHIVTTRNTYGSLKFDIFDTSTKRVVASGKGADEGAGEQAPTFRLQPGIYKIVRRGEPFATRMDYATVKIDGPTNYVIVIDAQSGAFRGSGIVTGDLPKGRDIAGIRLALNVGGSLNLNQQKNLVGTTNGVDSLLGLFGNFSLVFDKGNHFLKVDSRLQLTIRDPQTAEPFSTADFFTGSALYAFNVNNEYLGPYARVGFQTKVFPGYLYLRDDTATSGVVNVNRLDGTVDTFIYGDEANPDDLRIQVAKAFAPLILQEEVGANLKAVDIDLRLLKLTVATRLGFGFRQGITNGLLVVEGQATGTPINLFEVEDYSTLGPVAGASATVTFARWLFGSAELGLMVPVKDTARAGDGFGERLLIDLAATGGLKFPSLSFFYGTIDYTLRLQRDGYLTHDTQFAHTIMARANVQLF